MSGKKGVFISESLKEKKNEDNEMSSVNYESISSLLNGDIFHLQIYFLSIIIRVFNIADQRFKTKALEISSLKYYIHEAYASILSLIVKSENLDLQNIKKIS